MENTEGINGTKDLFDVVKPHCRFYHVRKKFLAPHKAARNSEERRKLYKRAALRDVKRPAAAGRCK